MPRSRRKSLAGTIWSAFSDKARLSSCIDTPTSRSPGSLPSSTPPCGQLSLRIADLSSYLGILPGPSHENSAGSRATNTRGTERLCKFSAQNHQLAHQERVSPPHDRTLHDECGFSAAWRFSLATRLLASRCSLCHKRSSHILRGAGLTSLLGRWFLFLLFCMFFRVFEG